MADAPNEPDPIKSNSTLNKAVGFVLVTAVLLALGYFLRG